MAQATTLQDEARRILEEIDNLQEYYIQHVLPGIEQVQPPPAVQQGAHGEPCCLERGMKRKREYLSAEAKQIMMEWILARLDNPYPSKEEKEDLARLTGLSVSQVQYWFVNARRRYLRPDS